jgi:hypothetical protein
MRFVVIRKWIVFILLAGAAGSIPKPVLGQSASTSEYEIKAAFLFNFAKFVEWPESVMGETNGSFIIGILGRDPFDGALDQTIGDKTVKGKTIVIKRFRHLVDLQYCHILFISESDKNGGIISLYTENDKVRFAIRLTATERANLKLSAKLLNLAKIIMD